jgi:uncharacterized protein YqfA (UPF0365 family)
LRRESQMRRSVSGKMVGMRLRKVPVGFIVDNRITAVKAGLDVRSDPLEAHYLAGSGISGA